MSGRRGSPHGGAAGGSARSGNRHRVRRWAASLSALALVVVLAWVGLGAWFLSARHRSEPTPSDVIVLLAGADDGRHALARELFASGIAPRLFVSNPLGAEEPKATALCRLPNATCFEPVPHTTAGEAEYIRGAAEEAESRGVGWTRISVVTNRPHAARAGAYFRRCLAGAGRGGADVEVRVVAIDSVDVPRLPIHVAREAAGFAKAAVQGGPC
ncbi:YdcF family protein [Dietzia sp.]|uniref:YdcF family protein n=1 Tax=Dietzia sp. TaxID=1871616 RepID=UPI002FDA8910